jgi:pimeloyl-ACP methyl ester carboxylesterase
MERQRSHTAIDTIAAESAKFTAPIVLVHGLWCTAAVWHKFMGYLAHRGWTCHALHLNRPSDHLTAPRLADYLEVVRGVVAACAAPPVIIGHDLGALLALQCAAPAVRARVALAPLVPPPVAATPNPILVRLRARLAMWRAQPLPVPRGRMATRYFGSSVPGGTRPDSSAAARELIRGDVRLALDSTTPSLVIAADDDPFSPSTDVARLAAHCGALFRSVPNAGHPLPWEAGWEQRVSEIHRWLVQTLGEVLLVPREEEE